MFIYFQFHAAFLSHSPFLNVLHFQFVCEMVKALFYMTRENENH